MNVPRFISQPDPHALSKEAKRLRSRVAALEVQLESAARSMREAADLLHSTHRDAALRLISDSHRAKAALEKRR